MDRNDLVSVALGEEPADLVVRNGQLVNVYSGEIYDAGIAVCGNRIAAIGEVDYCIGDHTTIVDADQRYLVPGFIECHMHFGATSLVMSEFARLVVPYGTAGIVIDFIEAGRMQGVKALRFFLDETNRTPLKPFFSPFWTNILGIDGNIPITLQEFGEILSWPECVELREWNVQTQRHDIPEVRELGNIARMKDLILSGHLRAQKGSTLQASVACGSRSDHEAKTREEALDRIRLGVAVQMRFGSAHLNEMQEMLKAFTRDRVDPRLFMFSTDEQDIDDIKKMGFLDDRIRIAISMGVPPMEAIRMASLNPATYLGKTGELGSLTPGRIAFINLVDDLRMFQISNVIYGNRIIAEHGDYLGELEQPDYPESFYNTIRLNEKLSPDDFEIAIESNAPKVKIRVIGVQQGTAETEERIIEIPVDEGRLHPSAQLDLAKISVFDRHNQSGKRTNAFIQGLNMKKGAIGTSYHLGPCNLAIVGVDDNDMALIGNRIQELGGGFVVAADGKILAEVAFPILGLVSTDPAEVVVKKFQNVKKIIKEELGFSIDETGLYTRFAIFFIPGVAPRLRISTDGLLRVELKGKELEITQVPLIAENK